MYMQVGLRRSTGAYPAAIAANAARAASCVARSKAGTPKVETFAPGKTIFLEGEDAEFYFEIVTGTVRCCGVTEDGRRQIYRFATADEMLGLGSEHAYSYSAEAVTTVGVRRHRLSGLDAAMADDERLRERVVHALREELSAVRAQMMLLGRLSASEKIVSFLRDLSKRSQDEHGCIHLSMSRGDIADYLGLTLETVSRKMNALKRMGAIELETPCRVRVPDFDRLDAMAEAA